MRHSTYQELLPFYLRPQRQLNPVAVANPEWMAVWFARMDEKNAHADKLVKSASAAELKAFYAANPTVHITEETVKSPIPPITYDYTVAEPDWKDDF